jgi:hypothetical protein
MIRGYFYDAPRGMPSKPESMSVMTTVAGSSVAKSANAMPSVQLVSYESEIAVQSLSITHQPEGFPPWL